MTTSIEHVAGFVCDQTALPSPCIGVCVITPENGLCQGCHRTIDEITSWGSATHAQQQIIWLAIEQRIADTF